MAQKSKDMILTVEKVCANPACGETFKAVRYWQRFCSKQCRMFAYFSREFATEQIMKGKAPDPYAKLPDVTELEQMDKAAQQDVELQSRKRAADEQVKREGIGESQQEANPIADWLNKGEQTR